MDNTLADSESTKTKLDKVLSALNHNISAQTGNMEECILMLNQSLFSKTDLLIPEENHEDLKKSLEILCRLPSSFFLFSNNFNSLGSMDICTIVQKYNKVTSAIEETNKKLAEMVLYSEKCVDSVID